MKSGRIVLCDIDAEYAKRLADYFNVTDWMPFRAEYFTDVDKMEQAIKMEPPDILLVNERLLKAEYMEYNLVVMCESLMIAEMDSPQLYKYQSAKNIGQEVLSWYTEHTGKRVVTKGANKCSVYGVYSLDKKREKAILSWEMAKYFSQRGDTLYVNLEVCPGMEQYLGEFSGDNLSDYLFFIRKNRESLGIRLRSVSREKLVILPPIKGWEDVRSISLEEWEYFIHCIKQETEYEYLVIDISESAGSLLMWFDLCDEIFIPLGEDYYGKSRNQQMMEFLQNRKDCNLKEKIQLFPVSILQGGKEYTRMQQVEIQRHIDEYLKRSCGCR